MVNAVEVLLNKLRFVITIPEKFSEMICSRKSEKRDNETGKEYGN